MGSRQRDVGSKEEVAQGDLALGEQSGALNSSIRAEPVASTFAVTLREKIMIARKESAGDVLVRHRKDLTE